MLRALRTRPQTLARAVHSSPCRRVEGTAEHRRAACLAGGEGAKIGHCGMPPRGIILVGKGRAAYSIPPRPEGVAHRKLGCGSAAQPLLHTDLWCPRLLMSRVNAPSPPRRFPTSTPGNYSSIAAGAARSSGCAMFARQSGESLLRIWDVGQVCRCLLEHQQIGHRDE
jgi:hypothetical protein